MTALEPCIGIDFGTSKSSMAWVNPSTGQAELILNAEGEAETPSVVYFSATETLVGTAAAQMLEDSEERERVVFSVKRELASNPIFTLPDRRVKAVDVAAEIFAKLKRDAEEGHFHQTITRAVVTCPAAFDALERDRIAEAARQAGFTEVVLLEEPVAAAIAYGEAGLDVGDRVLVYDLGAGTFDLAVVAREADGEYRMALDPKGMARCGGDDFDRAVYDHCDEAAFAEFGHGISPGGSKDLSFLRLCRQRKENLSAREKITINALLEGQERPVPFRHTLDRATFESLIEQHVATSVRLTEALVAEAEAAGYPIDTVVLIGGASRVPLVARSLAVALPMPPRKWQQQDRAVALGAAQHAHRLDWSAKNGNAPSRVAAPRTEPSATKALTAERSQTLQNPQTAPGVLTAKPEPRSYVRTSAHWPALKDEREATPAAESEPTPEQLLRPARERLVSSLKTRAVRGVRRTNLVVSEAGDGNFTTIADAIREAEAGATITVRPGLYREELVVRKPISLVGDGSDVADITIEGLRGPCLSLQGALPENVLDVRGLTLRGSTKLSDLKNSAASVPVGHLVLEDCRISSDSASGISVSGAGATVTLRRCQVHDCADAGISARSRATVNLEDCHISRHLTDGIRLHGGSSLIANGCRIDFVEEHGVIVPGECAATLADCIISDAGHGIVVHGGKLHLSSTEIRDTKATPLVVKSSLDALIQKCVILRAAGSGIEVTEGATPLVRGCQIVDAKLVGIAIRDRATGRFEDNLIVNHQGAGVLIESGANPVIRRCRIQHGHSAGIVVSGKSACVVEDCDVLEHEEDGIAILGQGTTLFRRCRVRQNKGFGIRIGATGNVKLENCELTDNAAGLVDLAYGGRVSGLPADLTAATAAQAKLNAERASAEAKLNEERAWAEAEARKQHAQAVAALDIAKKERDEANQKLQTLTTAQMLKQAGRYLAFALAAFVGSSAQWINPMGMMSQSTENFLISIGIFGLGIWLLYKSVRTVFQLRSERADTEKQFIQLDGKASDLANEVASFSAPRLHGFPKRGEETVTRQKSNRRRLQRVETATSEAAAKPSDST